MAKCAHLVRGLPCRAPITWKGILRSSELLFCTRHKKRAEKLYFWRGMQWTKLAVRSGGTEHG